MRIIDRLLCRESLFFVLSAVNQISLIITILIFYIPRDTPTGTCLSDKSINIAQTHEPTENILVNGGLLTLRRHHHHHQHHVQAIQSTQQPATAAEQWNRVVHRLGSVRSAGTTVGTYIFIGLGTYKFIVGKVQL